MDARDLNWSEADWSRLGAALTSSRHAQGLTQVETASRAGVSRATLQNLERGKPARLSTVHAVARALSWPSEYAENVLADRTGGLPPALHPESGRQAADAESASDLPLAVLNELKQGSLIDSEVVELGAESGARIIVVMRGDADMTPEQIEAVLEDWKRMRRQVPKMQLGETNPG